MPLAKLFLLLLEFWLHFKLIILTKKKNRQQELIVLENILQDLQKNKVQFNTFIERRISKVVSAKIIANYNEGVKIDKLSDYYFDWTNVLFWESHYPWNIVFRELINSGNVSIIRNAEIRSTLLDMNASYKEMFAVRAHMYDDYDLYL